MVKYKKAEDFFPMSEQKTKAPQQKERGPFPMSEPQSKAPQQKERGPFPMSEPQSKAPQQKERGPFPMSELQSKAPQQMEQSYLQRKNWPQQKQKSLMQKVPVVGNVQQMLNQQLGINLRVDQRWGRKTENAWNEFVRNVQDDRLKETSGLRPPSGEQIQLALQMAAGNSQGNVQEKPKMSFQEEQKKWEAMMAQYKKTGDPALLKQINDHVKNLQTNLNPTQAAPAPSGKKAELVANYINKLASDLRHTNSAASDYITKLLKSS